jgi:hypothetical protein
VTPFSGRDPERSRRGEPAGVIPSEAKDLIVEFKASRTGNHSETVMEKAA